LFAGVQARSESMIIWQRLSLLRQSLISPAPRCCGCQRVWVSSSYMLTTFHEWSVIVIPLRIYVVEFFLKHARIFSFYVFYFGVRVCSNTATIVFCLSTVIW